MTKQSPKLTDLFKKISSDSFFRHGGIMLSAAMIINFLNYLFQVVMGRMLGVKNLGSFNSLLALLIIVAVPLSSIQLVVTKFVSTIKAKNRRNEIGTFFLKALKLLVIFGTGGLIIVTAISGNIAAFLKLASTWPVIILGTYLLFGALMPVGQGTLQGLQRFEQVSVQGVITALSRLFFGVLLVKLGFGISGAMGATTLSCIVSISIALFLLRSLFSEEKSELHFHMSETYVYFFPVLLSGFAFTILTNIDMVLVKHFFSPIQAGYYAGAVIMGRIVLFVPGPIAAVMFPKASELHTLDKDPTPVLIKALSVVGVLSGAVTAAYFLLPHLAISVLFGKKFIASAPLIGWLGIAMTLFALLNVVMFFHLSIKNLKFVWVMLAGALSQITLIFLFHSSVFQVISILIVNSSVLLVLGVVLFLAARRSFVLPREEVEAVGALN